MLIPNMYSENVMDGLTLHQAQFCAKMHMLCKSMHQIQKKLLHGKKTAGEK
jgi:hypothetical protein